MKGKTLSEVVTVCPINGRITADNPAGEGMVCRPVKNLAKAKITVHSPSNGEPMEITPDYLTTLEPS